MKSGLNESEITGKMISIMNKLKEHDVHSICISIETEQKKLTMEFKFTEEETEGMG